MCADMQPKANEQPVLVLVLSVAGTVAPAHSHAIGCQHCRTRPLETKLDYGMLGSKRSNTMLSVASTVEPAHKSQLAVTVPAWACYRPLLRGSLARSLASGGASANDAWPVSSVHSPLVVCVVVGCAACPLPPVLFAVPVQPHFQIVCTLRSMCMCVSVLEGAGSGRGGAGGSSARVPARVCPRHAHAQRQPPLPHAHAYSTQGAASATCTSRA